MGFHCEAEGCNETTEDDWMNIIFQYDEEVEESPRYCSVNCARNEIEKVDTPENVVLSDPQISVDSDDMEVTYDENKTLGLGEMFDTFIYYAFPVTDKNEVHQALSIIDEATPEFRPSIDPE